MVQQNQFGGAPTEDPNAHQCSFLEICDTVKMSGVIDEAIRLRIFSFSLRDKAKALFKSLPYGFIATWEGLAQKFLTKNFPLSKAAQLRSEISQFRQVDFEPFHEAWERFKDLFRRCPQHGYQSWVQIELFYNGLNDQTRTIVNSAAGETLMSKTLDVAYSLLDEIATNSYQWPSERSNVRKVAGRHEVDPIIVHAAQISSLTSLLIALTSQGTQKKSESIMVASTAYQEVERENEQVHYVNDQNFNQTGNYYGNNYYQGFNNQAFEQKPSLEDILGTFISETISRFNKDEARLDNIETHITNMGATLKNLEVQIGQIATALQSQQKGTFPSDTVVNTREHCNAITLRN